MSADRWTIIGVLSWTAERFGREGLDSPRLDAELLLSHCLGVDRVRLYVDHDKPLQPHELERYRGLVKRRLAREPVAYITGTREFWSLQLAVDQHVLVPRPETESLVERALELLVGLEQPLVVDIGTGSGAVALALARERPDARVAAVELSGPALAVARANARRHGLEVAFYQGDLLDAVPVELSPQLVAANLPYIPTAQIDGLQAEVSRWEPRAALDGGTDGLDLIRRLADQTAARGASIALEIGSDQGQAVRALLERRGFSHVAVCKDLGGLDRVVTGRGPAA